MGLSLAIALLFLGVANRASGSDPIGRGEVSTDQLKVTESRGGSVVLAIASPVTIESTKSNPIAIPSHAIRANSTPKPKVVQNTVQAPKVAPSANKEEFPVGKVRVPDDFGPGAGQCVKYARYYSGIDLSGDAKTWPKQADGSYETSDSTPFVGGVVITDESKKHGHVAIVSADLGDSIEIYERNYEGKYIASTRVLSKSDPVIKKYISNKKVEEQKENEPLIASNSPTPEPEKKSTETPKQSQPDTPTQRDVSSVKIPSLNSLLRR